MSFGSRIDYFYFVITENEKAKKVCFLAFQLSYDKLKVLFPTALLTLLNPFSD